MAKIDWDALDEMDEMVSSREKVSRSQSPVGSLTDNRRMVTPHRNGAYKRLREYEG